MVYTVEHQDKLKEIVGERNMERGQKIASRVFMNVITSNNINQVGEGQRAETNPDIKKMFLHNNYFRYDGSTERAEIINKLRDKPLNCFIEVNINDEESKNGVKLEELDSFISEVIKYENINIIGLMCMTIKESEDKYQQFLNLKNIMEDINKKHNLNLKDMSMGMSDDYLEAIKAGSTYVRLGRILCM